MFEPIKLLTDGGHFVQLALDALAARQCIGHVGVQVAVDVDVFVEGEGIVELDGLVLGLVEVQSLSHEWFELCVNNTTPNTRERERERGNELASMNECELRYLEKQRENRRKGLEEHDLTRMRLVVRLGVVIDFGQRCIVVEATIEIAARDIENLRPSNRSKLACERSRQQRVRAVWASVRARAHVQLDRTRSFVQAPRALHRLA